MPAFPFKSRFIEARRGQCMVFLPVESGKEGFVCGAPTASGKSFCDHHHRATHHPLKKIKVNFRDASSTASCGVADHEPDLTEVLQ